MRVFMTGGTGTIGTSLSRRLIDRGDEVVVLSRKARTGNQPGMEWVTGDPREAGSWQEAVDGCDVVVNLVGHNLFAERWNERVKREIRESRVEATRQVVAAVRKSARPPRTFVQGSAIGYYGDGGDRELTEESPAGTGFLPELCVEWEGAARPVIETGARLAMVRTGVVLARGSGALGSMEPIFKWLPGGAAPVGGRAFLPSTGAQWMSWIHLQDIVGLFLLAIDSPEAVGPINGTAPHPVTNYEFSRELARAVHRPFLPFGPPTALLRVVLGEVASAVTDSQKVMPRVAERLGYAFRFPTLKEALADLYGGVKV